MKKLLGILSALGIAATTSGSVVSCGEEMQPWAMPKKYDLPDWTDTKHKNSSDTWLEGTKLRYEADKRGILRIYMNHIVKTPYIPIEAVSIFKTDSNGTKPGEKLDIKIDSIGLAGNYINIEIDKSNYDEFIKIKWTYCYVKIDQSIFKYNESQLRGMSSGTSISWGPIFKVPNEANLVS